MRRVFGGLLMAALAARILAACGTDPAGDRPTLAEGGGPALPDGSDGGGDPRPIDDAGSSDGAPSHDASTCDGAVANASFERGCGTIRLTVMSAPGQTAKVHVRGFGGWGDCTTIDEAHLTQGGAPIAALALTPDPDDPYGTGASAWVADAPAALVTACAGDSVRVDAFGVSLEASQPQGHFTVSCGSGGGWPPASVLTCNDGLPSSQAFPAVDANGQSRTGPGLGSTNLTAMFAHAASAGAILSVNPTMRVLPFARPFVGGAPAPFDASGWTVGINEVTMPGTGPVSVVTLSATDQHLPGVCVPTSTPMPAFVGRLTGTTAAGTFRSELYVPQCPLF